MKQINLSITTHCNRRCPLCCVRSGPPERYPWEYFVEAARYLYGIPILHLTGGEPTTHPDFEGLVYGLPKLFGCKQLWLWTNGYGWTRCRAAFWHFDRIHVSHYTAETCPGSADNTALVRAMKQELGERVRVENDLLHIPMQRTGRTNPCGRLRRDVVTYVGGLAYPCCVGPGPESSRGIPLTEDWKKHLIQMAPPCDTCGFAV